MRLVSRHTDERWVLLYVERWLKAPLQKEDGTVVQRDRGTPQGSAISPLLANLFLHYAFDTWLTRGHPYVRFERYADDSVVHCKSRAQAQYVLKAITERMARVGLELNQDKTYIVYCKDADRRGSFEHERFTFLGYTFRPRLSKSRHGKHFVNFSPAVSDGAIKAIGKEIRSWRLNCRSDKTLTDLARIYNPILQGWISYYGRFYKSRLLLILRRINEYLVRWAMRKYKRLRGHYQNAVRFIERVATREPNLFAHWRVGVRSSGWARGAG
jgi:RNA-directed DNA polymerase